MRWSLGPRRRIVNAWSGTPVDADELIAIVH